MRKALVITLAALLLEGERLPKRDLFWRKEENWAVRRGPWKLVGGEDRVQLFNLDDDVDESEDLSAQRPELVQELLASYKAWEQDVDKS
jgi:hypothetical protein